MPNAWQITVAVTMLCVAVVAWVFSALTAACVGLLFGAAGFRFVLLWLPASFSEGEAALLLVSGTGALHAILTRLVGAVASGASVGLWRLLASPPAHVTDPRLASTASLFLPATALLVLIVSSAWVGFHAPGSSHDAGLSPSTRVARLSTVAAACIVGIAFPLLCLSLGGNPFIWVLAFIASDGVHVALLLWWMAVLPLFLLVLGPIRGRDAPEGGSGPVASEAVDDRSGHRRGSRRSGRRSERRMPRPAGDAAAWSRVGLPTIVVRKLYHVLVLALFLPGTLLRPHFMSLSYSVALALLLLVEAVRATDQPTLGPAVHAFMAKYTDARDGGRLILTHIYLLLGCAAPLWLAIATGALPAAAPAASSLASVLAPAAGVIVLGAGDAAAAAVGVSHGHWRWPGSRKTLEGSSAALAATLLVSAAYVVCAAGTGVYAWPSVTPLGTAAVVVAAATTCLLEAATDQVDNLVLPPFFAIALLVASSLDLGVVS